MTMVTRHMKATEDPPPTGVPNPIHDEDGAGSAGYAGALVSGVRTYGWVADVIAQALGNRWLDSGWVDFALRRPLYADEPLIIEVREANNGEWPVKCVVETDQRVVLDGTAGLDRAPWLGELAPPTPSTPKPQPAELPGYDLDHVPMRQPLNPLRLHVSAAEAASMVSEDLALGNTRYTGKEPPIHPYYIAARMSPLTRHNFLYGPTIHVRSQIQHLREAVSGQDFITRAQIIDAYDRKGHWYQVLDGAVADEVGDVALLRHHTIFRPRGT